MSRVKIGVLFAVVLVLLGIAAYAANAYQYVCLTMGQSLPTAPNNPCSEQFCQYCVDSKGYSTLPQRCGGLSQCDWSGGGSGGGPTTENIPSVTITSPASGLYYSQNMVTLTYSVLSVNPITSISYRIDAQASIVICTGTTQCAGYMSKSITVPQQPLSDGAHTVSIIATANDGKTSPVTSVSFSVDTAQPVISSTLPAAGSNVVGSYTDSFSVTYTELISSR
jgi:hypothetical protein